MPTKIAAARPEEHGNKGQPKANAIAARADSRQRAVALATRQHREEKPFRAGSLLPEDGVDVTDRIGLMQIGARDCHWISGDPLADRSYCGKPTKDGSAWCPEHHRRVYPGRAPIV